MTRRHLIHHGLFAGAALALPTAAASPDHAAGRDVLDGLRRIGRRIRLRHDGEEVRVLVSIDRLDAFLDPAERGRALPYADIRAEGSRLSFEHRGTRYGVEILMPEDFDRRAAEFPA